MLGGATEIRVEVELVVQIEAAQIKDFGKWHASEVGCERLRAG